MKKILLPYVIAPAALLIVVTIIRAWLEIESPDHPLMKFVSANGLSVVWMLVVPAIMLKKGLSLGAGLLAALLFFVLHRIAIGAVYAFAWADKWQIAGTDTPVRYVVQTQKDMPDASPMMVFAGLALFPVPFGVAAVFIIWSITWVISFRDRRPFARAAASAY